MRTCREAKEVFKKVMMNSVMFVPPEGFCKCEVGGGGKGLHPCSILTYNLDSEVVRKEL